MGYTHYWERPKNISKAAFTAIVEDFKKLLPAFQEAGIKLADGLGDGEPEITSQLVQFNGATRCGHPKNELISIPWPSEGAGGIGNGDDAIVGNWFAGVELQTRACNGDCSYETFSFPRTIKLREWQKPDEKKHYFAFCKTAFRPYDVAVTAFLVIAKHHLGDAIVVSSDGDSPQWFDAKLLCQLHLGYGMQYDFSEQGLVAIA